jgi:hypothetical protein
MQRRFQLGIGSGGPPTALKAQSRAVDRYHAHGARRYQHRPNTDRWLSTVWPNLDMLRGAFEHHVSWMRLESVERDVNLLC